jgi:ABC-2 type transport system permease protein
VSVGATLVAVELFALSGGLGVIFFEPTWLQQIARWDPLTYMIHSLQQAVFYQSTAGVGRDVAILAASALLAGVAGTLAMRRDLDR